MASKQSRRNSRRRAKHRLGHTAYQVRTKRPEHGKQPREIPSSGAQALAQLSTAHIWRRLSEMGDLGYIRGYRNSPSIPDWRSNRNDYNL